MVIDLFVTYLTSRRRDNKHFTNINNGLVVMKQYFHKKRNVLIDTFHRGIISPGQKIDLEIKQHLDKADIILLLLSPDFLAEALVTPFKKEFAAVVSKHKKGRAIVIPILTSPCLWDYSIFEDLQPLPRNLKPIEEWSSRNRAYKHVHLELIQVIEDFIDSKSANNRSSGNIFSIKRRSDDSNNLLKFINNYIDPDEDVGMAYNCG